jgi:uncharacterized protein
MCYIYSMQSLYSLLAAKVNIPSAQVQKTIALLEEGATIPFIARYRKEQTGSLDEVQIAAVQEAWQKYLELEKRKTAILKAIDEQGKLSAALTAAIEGCTNLHVLEDLYLPFKIKRKTKAAIARELGLEPLADYLMLQGGGSISEKAKQFLTKEVLTAEDALQGGRDILAEKINEHPEARRAVRVLFEREAKISAEAVKAKEEKGLKYKDYFNFNEKLATCPSHRLLALLRGEEEGFLRLSIAPVEDRAVVLLERLFIRNKSEAAAEVEKAIKDSYKRLLSPSVENECRKQAKEKADQQAIQVFADNLRQLLLAPPLGPKRVLAIDPGFRTGCKMVFLDEQGTFLKSETIFPHSAPAQAIQAAESVKQMVATYRPEAIAIGNATAGRETESFIQNLQLDKNIDLYMVNESGASVYSASAIAREEFPEEDVTVRGAISIGRRLMDPLAELVKIDPKAIGVGQYQHDVDQAKLKSSLDTVVESAVNKVGVNLNTASKHLLSYVSGIGPILAQHIVNYRKEQGPFGKRSDLKKVPRMGEKTLEQCAGFLRIPSATNPLDATAVHPESYPVVEAMAKDLGCRVKDLIQEKGLRDKINLNAYISPKIGLPTLQDIIKELASPGLDPREALTTFSFAPDITKPEHLQLGMKLKGLVTNITKFGAFIDIGVKQDGLVHISHLSADFVSDPNTIVHINQQVEVKIIELDLPRKRIALSMK